MSTGDNEQEVYGFVLTDKFVYTRKDPRYFNRAIVSQVKQVDIREGSTSANPFMQVVFAVALILAGGVLFLSAISAVADGDVFSKFALGGSPALFGLAVWMIYDSMQSGWVVTFEGPGHKRRFIADERCTRTELQDIAAALTKRYGWPVSTSFL